MKKFFFTSISLLLLFSACKENNDTTTLNNSSNETRIVYDGIGYTITSDNTCYISSGVNCTGSYEIGSLKYNNKTYTVDSISNYAFAESENLKAIVLPNSVISIGRQAFIDCYSLSSITIPSSVISIGEYAFSSCIKLSAIHVKSSTPINITNAFHDFNYSLCTLGVPKGSKAAYKNAAGWNSFTNIVEE